MKIANLKNILVAGATVALMSGCQSTGSKTGDAINRATKYSHHS